MAHVLSEGLQKGLDGCLLPVVPGGRATPHENGSAHRVGQHVVIEETAGQVDDGTRELPSPPS